MNAYSVDGVVEAYAGLIVAKLSPDLDGTNWLLMNKPTG